MPPTLHARIETWAFDQKAAGASTSLSLFQNLFEGLQLTLERAGYDCGPVRDLLQILCPNELVLGARSRFYYMEKYAGTKLPPKQEMLERVASAFANLHTSMAFRDSLFLREMGTLFTSIEQRPTMYVHPTLDDNHPRPTDVLQFARGCYWGIEFLYERSDRESYLLQNILKKLRALESSGNQRSSTCPALDHEAKATIMDTCRIFQNAQQHL